MNRLQTEIHRLYPPAPLADNADSAVRHVVLQAQCPPGWPALRTVWEGVQTEWGWPAPGIAVNGRDAYQLWFSFAQPLPLAQARGLVRHLIARFLPDADPRRLRVLTETANTDAPLATPPQAQPSGNWSAFVSPDLAAVFGDEPVLDIPPGDEAQAELLARLRSVPADAVADALRHLAPAESAAQAAAASASPEPAWQSPRDFLMRVMNDPATPLALRIEAAKALLGHEGAAPSA